MADNKKPGGGQPFSIPVSGVGPEQARRLRVPQHFRYDNSLATISNQYGDGWAVIDMPVGNYCYRQFNLSVTNTVPIASVTGLVGGRNIVFTAKTKNSRPLFIPQRSCGDIPNREEISLELELPNKLGGFAKNGSEYCIKLEAEDTTPAPWSQRHCQ